MKEFTDPEWQTLKDPESDLYKLLSHDVFKPRDLPPFDPFKAIDTFEDQKGRYLGEVIAETEGKVDIDRLIAFALLNCPDYDKESTNKVASLVMLQSNAYPW